MLGEVLEAFDGFETKATNDGQRGISQGGEHLRSMACVGPCLILSACDVANIVQTILDTPMCPRQRQELIRSRLLGSQTCNGVDGFGAFLVPNDTLAGNAAHLRETSPGRGQEGGQRSGCFQPPGLDPTVTFLDGLSASKIRRRRPCL
jgi:hypothetical protein